MKCNNERVCCLSLRQVGLVQKAGASLRKAALNDNELSLAFWFQTPCYRMHGIRSGYSLKVPLD
jgi:hypothetical protein